jgi:hypothetical protein
MMAQWAETCCRIFSISNINYYICYHWRNKLLYYRKNNGMAPMKMYKLWQWSNTLCYFFQLLIPLYVSTLHSAPCSQTLSKNKSFFPLKTTSDVFDVYTKWPIFMKFSKRRKRSNTYGPFWILLYHWKIFWRTKPMVLSFKSRIYISTELSWKPEIV